MGTLLKTSQPFVAREVASPLLARSGSEGGRKQCGTCADTAESLVVQAMRESGLRQQAERPVLAFSSKDSGADAGPLAPTLRSGNHAASHANGGVPPAVASATQVRRMTPTECERLQGFPDGYTNIPMPTKRRAQKKRETDEEYAAYLEGVPEKRAVDSPRYKALGNSMAVPVMRWIGERIQMVENGKGRGDGKVARALSAGLIERADKNKNDPEAVKLTQKGLDRL